MNIAAADAFMAIFGYTRVTTGEDMDSNHADRIKEAAAYLQEKRKDAGYTQAQLAHLIGVTPSSVGVMESGSKAPWPQYIYDTAEACNFDADEVFALLGRVPPDLIEIIGSSLANIKRVRRCLKGGK